MPPPYTYKAKNANYTSTVVESMTDFTGKTHTYTYDDNGNITSETVDGQTIRYEYDDQNRLTHYFDPIANRTRIYTYDDRGNILDVKYCEYMTEEEYTAFVAEYGENTIPSYLYTYGDATWADLLTNYSGTNITYDELGNPLNWVGGRGITLTWENGRQLKQYKQGSARQCDYTYNADGLRTGKTITQSGSVTKQTEYYIVNGQYIGEVSNIGGTNYVIAYVYDENGAPAGINVNGSAFYFAKNLQGDVTAILDYQGNVVANYRYDAWGDLISVTDANGNAISSSTDIAKLNPFRYRGYMYDDESGFYYLRSRYYDPNVGRFLNADTLVTTGTGLGGYNMFAYCNGNPIAYIDTTGNLSVLSPAYGPIGGPLRAKVWPKLLLIIAPILPQKTRLSPVNPITGGVISQGYHRNHPAIDIVPTDSNLVRAAFSGTVVDYKTSYPNDFRSYDDTKMESYGNYVVIESVINGKTYHIRYAHLQYGSSFYTGQKIFVGSILGKAGSTGRTDNGYGGPFVHLHLEIITWDDYGNKKKLIRENFFHFNFVWR